MCDIYKLHIYASYLGLTLPEGIPVSKRVLFISIPMKKKKRDTDRQQCCIVNEVSHNLACVKLK